MDTGEAMARELERFQVQAREAALWCLEPDAPIPAGAPHAVQLAALRSARVVDCNRAAMYLRGAVSHAEIVGRPAGEIGLFGDGVLLEAFVRGGWRMMERSTSRGAGERRGPWRQAIIGELGAGLLHRIWLAERDAHPKAAAEGATDGGSGRGATATSP